MSEVAAAESVVNRPGVFTLVIRSKSALYAAWMPLIKHGGIFLPSNRSHSLGEEVLILLTLLDDPNKIPLQGSVAWINPAHSAGNRPQGIGVQLHDGEVTRELRKKVEGLLAGALQSSRPTHTI
ncbi:MAG TPA: PilZ domain-containing protein [Usitatibacter sp.]|jgi:type IV pilus assembly protein PilZ|nr:PilZ domain-containing protein [Usitatibacter sp.]